MVYISGKTDFASPLFTIDISDGPDTTSPPYSTTKKVIAAHETDEEQTNERWAANKVLIERLLHKLNRQKRAPVAHGVEMLLAIDHMVYNE